MKDVISIRDFEKKDIEHIFSLAARMEEYLASGKKPLENSKVVATIFLEPSTRTRLSFQTAAQRLGCSVIDFNDPEITSMAKGETFTDTIRIIDGYADAIVLRSPLEGAARWAARVASAPVINAGDGGNQHPTQTMLDLYTIRKLKGNIHSQVVALVGDLKHARTMRSLLYGLSMWGAKTVLIAPKGLEMEEGIIHEVRERFNADVEKRQTMDISDIDVLYVCRIQKERFLDKYEAEKVQREFRITHDVLAHAKDDLIILHPLPKLDEISSEVDSDPRAKYFEQAKNGIPIRMALLYTVLTR